MPTRLTLFTICFCLALVSVGSGAVSAQTPEPTPAPLSPDANPEANPVLDPLQGGGLPGPFTINDPPEGTSDVGRAFWDIDNMRGMVSMFQTTFVLAQRNWQISLFIAIAVFSAVIGWLVSMIRERSRNL
ncbi:MAG: hypothetical protein KDD89_00750 [Anaerolineales bacterium]|nr:hypothetical protein [Anaerolineales bacterium]